MVSRVERHKKKRKTKKVILLIGVVILSISIGSGVKTTFADTDVSTMLINWFNNKQSESIHEIDTAITAEKEILLAQLKTELKIEMDAAEKELNHFTQQEKVKRISTLRKHAAELISNLKIDNSNEKKAIIDNINSIVENALAQMDGVAATIHEKVVVPAPESPEKDKPVEVPVTKPKPISESVPSPITPTPNPSPETEPIIEPVTGSDTEDEIEVVDEPSTESTPEPSSKPNKVVEGVQANRDSSLEDEVSE